MPMPLYLDRHELTGATAVDVAGAHLKDLEAQERFAVRFLSYWFDYERQTAFCLAEGPNGEAINAAHAAAHGLVANSVIEVDWATLGRFLMPPDHPPGEPYVETATAQIVLSNRGGRVLNWRLKDYRDDVGAPVDLVPIVVAGNTYNVPRRLVRAVQRGYFDPSGLR